MFTVGSIDRPDKGDSMVIIYSLLLSASTLATPSPLQQLTQQNAVFWMQLLDAPQEEVKLNALRVLSNLRRADSVARIERLFQAESPRLRYFVAATLGRIPSPLSQAALTRQLSKEKNSYVKSEINRSLNLLRDVFERKLDLEEALESSPQEFDSESFDE